MKLIVRAFLRVALYIRALNFSQQNLDCHQQALLLHHCEIQSVYCDNTVYDKSLRNTEFVKKLNSCEALAHSPEFTISVGRRCCEVHSISSNYKRFALTE